MTVKSEQTFAPEDLVVHHTCLQQESTFLTQKHVLLALDEQCESFMTHPYFAELKNKFCGVVITDLSMFDTFVPDEDTNFYLLGNIENIELDIIKKKQGEHVFIVVDFIYCEKELIDYNEGEDRFEITFPKEAGTFISIGSVPMNINNVGE
jgi:hypothetical protein